MTSLAFYKYCYIWKLVVATMATFIVSTVNSPVLIMKNFVMLIYCMSFLLWVFVYVLMYFVVI